MEAVLLALVCVVCFSTKTPCLPVFPAVGMGRFFGDFGSASGRVVSVKLSDLSEFLSLLSMRYACSERLCLLNCLSIGLVPEISAHLSISAGFHKQPS